MSTNLACGIDFGASNSTVAVAHGAAKALVALEGGETTLPSALFFKDCKPPTFGREAIQSYINGDDGRLMRGLKKVLGTSLMDDKTLIGNRNVGFSEILKTFIAHLKNRADAHAGHDIQNVVMGRPVHFHDDNPDADARSEATLGTIARDIGFKNVEFLYEPIAAAFAHEAGIETERLSLVVDLGGGTSDFTVIRICSAYAAKPDRRDDILATAGVRIGGTTFDYRLSFRHVMPALGMGTEYRDDFDREKRMPMPVSVYAQLSDWSQVNFAQTRKAIADTEYLQHRALEPAKLERLLQLQQDHLGHALLAEVEAAKIALTAEQKYTARLADLGSDFAVPLTRRALEQAIKDDIARVFHTIDACLMAAGVTKDQIDLVILTGGSTELPVVNTMVAKLFPHAAISQGNKLDSVGLGLAYRAATIF